MSTGYSFVSGLNQRELLSAMMLIAVSEPPIGFGWPTIFTVARIGLLGSTRTVKPAPR
jgi:hypothetical protein